MLNISGTELLIVLLLALIVLGPQKLPELARSIGRGMREFRKMQDEVKDMVQIDLNPEPPTVHQPGVSGPKRTTSRPHRTPRPASSDVDDGVPASDPPPDADARREAAPDVELPSPAETSDPPDDADPDGPPAAAGAG